MINLQLKTYIENKILPLYELNDRGHDLSHIMYVIKRSLNFAKDVPSINYNMVYTIACYHDIAHHIDPKNHEKVSAELLERDMHLKEFFSLEEINVMRDAVYDHRASSLIEPRTVYGKIVSSADRNVDIDTLLRRICEYRIINFPYLSIDEIIESGRLHALEKYGPSGYAKEKMYFKDEEYEAFLEEIALIARDPDLWRRKFFDINYETLKTLNEKKGYNF